MIAAWMLYATVVGALLAAAAWAADAACRLLRLPRRGVWSVALVAIVATPALVASRTDRAAALSGDAPVADLTTSATAARRVASAAPAHTSTHGAMRPPNAMRLASLRRGALTIGPTHPLRALDRPLAALWLAGGAAGAVLLLAGTRRLARARRAWRALGIGDAPVLVSDDYGPAVAGVRRPVVVLPRWALRLAPDDLALVLAHERAHVAARDPLLLAAALATLLVLPWLLPLWFVVVRLRLAVESDCDARVLRTHPDARRYGRLLVDVAARAVTPSHGLPNGLLAGSVGLLDARGGLEARVRGLLAPAPGRRARVRAAALAGLASGAAALAGASPEPQRVTAPRATPTTGVTTASAAAPALVDSLRGQVAALTARLDSVTRTPAPTPRANRDASSLAIIPARRQVDSPTDDALREAVGRVAPNALTGAMGHRPTVWVLLDSTGRAVEGAEGEETMSWGTGWRPRFALADTTGLFSAPRGDEPKQRVLDADGFYRTFPSLHEAQLHSFGWSRITAGADTVNVLWGRPTSLGWKLSDFDDRSR